MNTKIKKEWIEALTSGEFDQTTGHLKSRSGHCCLGVLCEVAKAHGVVVDRKQPASYGSKKEFYDPALVNPRSDISSGALPDAVQEWSGLNNANPDTDILLDGSQYPQNLAQLNDSGYYTFADIAKVIERNF